MYCSEIKNTTTMKFKLKYNLSIVGIILRLIAGMLWAILAVYTGVFFLFGIAMLSVVMALTGYDPVLDLIGVNKAF